MKDLKEIFDFIVVLDKMKSVYRQTYVLSEDRQENDAEHSWHMAVMVSLLIKYANEKTDELRTVKMCLVHDLVEIYAGDMYCYDVTDETAKHEREYSAAEKLFGQTEEPLRSELFGLWEEFEERKTPEARFAVAMDRTQPILLNLERKGRSWIRNGISFSQVAKRVSLISDGSETVYNEIYQKIVEAKNNGWLKDC